MLLNNAPSGKVARVCLLLFGFVSSCSVALQLIPLERNNLSILQVMLVLHWVTETRSSSGCNCYKLTLTLQKSDSSRSPCCCFFCFVLFCLVLFFSNHSRQFYSHFEYSSYRIYTLSSLLKNLWWYPAIFFHTLAVVSAITLLSLMLIRSF